MRLEEKQQVTEELAARLRGTESVFLTDFTGLTVKEITEFRAKARAGGLEYRVVKNTLARRAIEGLDLEAMDEHLVGPTGLLLGGSDPVMPAKIIRDFAKGHGNRPVVKIALVDKQVVSPENVEVMADLPSREELLGYIAGGLTASVAGIAGVLSAVIRDIAYMVEEVARVQAAVNTEQGAN
ncbi:MAG: 50S ribosomal protein L10 [Gemmatimonadota bacterium]|jgi:large subunit ribosomal protein L10|nr:MAG: 50S ribosomal protein L10 [Gemmatimonadota bacterium]